MKRVRITGDGSVTGTRVVDAETGEPIECVRSVRFSHWAGDVPIATVELIGPVIDVSVIADAFETSVPSRPAACAP